MAKKRGRKLVCIDGQLLAEMFKTGKMENLDCIHGLPKDAVFITAIPYSSLRGESNKYDLIHIIVESEEFKPKKKGELFDIVTPEYRRIIENEITKPLEI